MNRTTTLAIAALPAALLLGANHAFAARPLLAELLARALDATGIAIDYQIAAIDRETAEAIFLENQINAEIPVLGGYDEPGLNAFQKRVIRHEELTKKFKAEFPVYQQKKKAYDAAVAEFDCNCGQGFTASDLGAAKAKLGIQ